MMETKNRKQRFSLRGLRMWLYFFLTVGVVYYGFTQLNKCNKERTLELEPTPLRIENIEAIAQLATLSYREEFVVDSIEYYHNTTEQIKGELDKIFRQGDLKNTIKNYKIDRRLTLISTVSGEIGFDLSKIEQLTKSIDTIIIRSPKPTVLNLGIDFRETEVFIEIGKWKDSDRRLLEGKALAKAKSKLKKQTILQRSVNKYEELIRKTVPTKTCIFEYYESK